MKDEGVVFLTYKSLFYELFRSVDDRHVIAGGFGPFPDDLPDRAVE